MVAAGPPSPQPSPASGRGGCPLLIQYPSFPKESDNEKTAGRPDPVRRLLRHRAGTNPQRRRHPGAARGDPRSGQAAAGQAGGGAEGARVHRLRAAQPAGAAEESGRQLLPAPAVPGRVQRQPQDRAGQRDRRAHRAVRRLLQQSEEPRRAARGRQRGHPQRRHQRRPRPAAAGQGRRDQAQGRQEHHRHAEGHRREPEEHQGA
ncbi:hypothetical protein D3C81_1620740 [compost metagenome]